MQLSGDRPNRVLSRSLTGIALPRRHIDVRGARRQYAPVAVRPAVRAEGALPGNRQRWRTQTELANAIFEWIEGFYNRRRRHSALG